ncbi:hypothetical protein C8R43DRAFT_864605, partial [Mycena crocata]
LKPKGVKYVIASHDQGWCSDPGIEGGTYRGYTWFEAAILRPTQMPTTFVEPGFQLDDAVTAYDPTLEVEAPDESTRWMVERNFTASMESRQHSVSWYTDATTLPGSEIGCGDGVGFVSRLAAGDRIALLGRAL